MSRVTLLLANQATKEKAIAWVKNAPWNTRFELKESKRTLDQSAKMWAMLTEISRQLKDWPGGPYTADDWKDYGMHALKKARWMPDEEGGMVPIGMRSSDLSKAEMSDLIELLYAFGARHGVTFTEPASDSPP
jgi:hypothetical protein